MKAWPFPSGPEVPANSAGSTGHSAGCARAKQTFDHNFVLEQKITTASFLPPPRLGINFAMLGHSGLAKIF